MRFYACLTCSTCWQIGGPTEELQSTWMVIESQGLLHCPTPKCGGNLMRVTAPVSDGKFTNREIPLPIFFRAVNGFGSPDGKAASVATFKKLITTKKVVEVHAEPAGQPERVILKRLVLEGGIVLHFDTSSKGACCYYIEEPGPSCLEVFDASVRQGSDSNREEAGRASEAGGADGAAAGDSGTAAAPAAERSESGGVSSVPEAGDVPEPDRSADGATSPGEDVRV